MADINLGPLTTAFTAPSACNSITVSQGGSTYDPYLYPRLFTGAASCFPSGYPIGFAALTATYSKYNYQDQHVYYSPGLCPSGWPQYNFPDNGETLAACCPPGFATLTTPAVVGPVSSTYCTSRIAGPTTVTTVPYSGDGSAVGGTGTFIFGNVAITAPAVWVRWKDSDFTKGQSTTTLPPPMATTSKPTPTPTTLSPDSPTTVTVVSTVSASTVVSEPSTASTAAEKPTSTTPTTLASTDSPSSLTLISSASTASTSTLKTSSSQTSTSTLVPVSSSSSNPNADPRNTGLPLGAKIGIGVGAGLVALLLLGFLAFLLRRRRKPQTQETWAAVAGWHSGVGGGGARNARVGRGGGGGGGGGGGIVRNVVQGSGNVNNGPLLGKSELAGGAGVRRKPVAMVQNRAAELSDARVGTDASEAQRLKQQSMAEMPSLIERPSEML